MDTQIRGSEEEGGIFIFFWVFRVFLKIFFPIEVEKKGGWRRRMKGKRVFEGGGRTKIKEEKEEHHKKNSGRSDKAKKNVFLVGFFLTFFWFMGRASPVTASPWLL
jgi:hypothetical protein